MLKCLPMGCLPSRSTTVSPVELSSQSNNNNSNNNFDSINQTTTKEPFESNGAQKKSNNKIANDYLEPISKKRHKSKKELNKKLAANVNGHSFDHSDGNSLSGTAEDDIMSILMNDQEKLADAGKDKDSSITADTRLEQNAGESDLNISPERLKQDNSYDASKDPSSSDAKHSELKRTTSPTIKGSQSTQEQANSENAIILSSTSQQKSIDNNSFDEELNVDLLRQYIAIDYEIAQLEDKDALRIYHEKIEQLEQLERELDMISSEAEEVAARSETNSQLERFQSPNMMMMMMMNDSKAGDGESNSMLSGATGSMSAISSFKQNNGQQTNKIRSSRLDSSIMSKNNSNRQSSLARKVNTGRAGSNEVDNQVMDVVNGARSGFMSSNNNLSYSTVEEVFNRKIVLEKERDKLKKEVEIVIIECDKLQQRYKKRDEILDKLFDGRAGNGLENHLEQQLNWLMEQKHYVDQVFYAWKRAETLTSQTCEQFASALELLKRLPKVQDESERSELAKSIGQLLIKSRQDMEQAQRYNPNVDAPFFTDTETERFDKIIETISSQSISQSEYSQIATVIQFAYKRAVSIKLWLEQILQITIARDSFELAEEYKWIAIQLRKERITLIKSKLQDSPYRSMAQSIQEQLAKQRQQLMIGNGNNDTSSGNNGSIRRSGQVNEVNRDSGIESDDIDIEEEIYRLLEMNKTCLEAAIAANGPTMTNGDSYQLKPNQQHQNKSIMQQQQMNDQMMRERIQKRVRGEQALASSSRSPLAPGQVLSSNESEAKKLVHQQEPNGSMTTTTNSIVSAASGATPSKLKVELDEATRQSLLSKYAIQSAFCIPA